MRGFSNNDAGRRVMVAPPADDPQIVDDLERSVEKGRYKLKKLRERREFCTRQYEEEMEQMDEEEVRLKQQLEQAQAKLQLARDEQGSTESSSEGDSRSEESDVSSEETASPPASEVLGRTTGRMASDSMPSSGRASSQAGMERRVPFQSPRSGGAVRPARAPRSPQQVYVPGSMRQRAENSPQNSGIPSPSKSVDQGRVRAPPPGFDAPAHRSLRGAPPPPPSRSVFDRIGQSNGNGTNYHHYSTPTASVESDGDPGFPEMSDTRPAGAIREWRPRNEAAGEATHVAGPEQQAQRGGEVFSREDTEGVRGEVNAQMDAMMPHDGATNGNHLLSREGAGEGQEGAPAARKVREWDLNKSADPQADMRNEPYWGARQPMSNWADDDPNSPSQAGGWGNGKSMGPRASGNMVVRSSEGDFPGLRLGANSTAPKQDQEWMGNDDRMNASFPTLGGGDAPRPAGAWGAGGALLKERLTDGRPFVRLGASPQAEGPTQSVPDFERGAGLRHPSDDSADQEHKVQVKSNKDLRHMEEIRGRGIVNIMEGLELHLGVLLKTEQALLERQILEWVRLGHQNMLRGRTFSAPRKWARGKGRVTIQFGCCYNYAKDNQGRLPGIIPEEVVEPLPPVLVALAKRLVRWGIIPRELEPDTAIVNVYEEDDCIPPHIDHHDFTRPFCTVSLLSQEDIIFGSRLVPEAPGVFYNANGPTARLPLPTGSCLILKGNGADLAMHCVPPVKRRRMSITLRKMGMGHSAAVKAEAARVAAGANRTARVNGPPSDSWRSPSPATDAPGPRSVNLSDLIVTKESRELMSADKSERGGRWENEGSVERE